MHVSSCCAGLASQHTRENFFQAGNIIIVDTCNTSENTALDFVLLLHFISAGPHSSYSLGNCDHLTNIHAAIDLEFSHPKGYMTLVKSFLLKG